MPVPEKEDVEMKDVENQTKTDDKKKQDVNEEQKKETPEEKKKREEREAFELLVSGILLISFDIHKKIFKKICY